ncbi:MAG TPA: SRPBCC family protein [Gemmatimonadales bacterium]
MRAIALFTVVLAACGRGSSMNGLLEIRNLSVSIHRPPQDVYAFITNGANVPRWAAGLGTTMRRVDGEWLAEGGPVGSVRVRFAPPNDLGVADHHVVLGTGVAVHNPIRVVPNGTGSTVTFTLMRQPGVSARQFNQDAKTVQKDLETLRALLEQP